MDAPIARHAIVTGGSSGIGKATAVLLARRGASVTILARRSEVLAAARAEIEAARRSPDQQVLDRSVDVSDRAAVEAAIADAAERVGPCDLLITCAGIAHPGYFSEIPIETFERTMAVNYFGALYAIRAVVPGMRARGGGRIQIVSSGLGVFGVFGYTAYCPSKFALRGLAESLRPELARDHIDVSICYPPDTDTPQLAMENLTKPRETRAISAAANKTWQPEDVAAQMVAGLDKRRFVVTPGWEMSMLYQWHSLLQPAVNLWFDRIATKAAR